MQINELNENRLRELARMRPDGDARVLSIFINLDPAEFATPPARASEISSVIDDSPLVEPLVGLLGAGGNWMVVLVNRQIGRLLRGDGHNFQELAAIQDD